MVQEQDSSHATASSISAPPGAALIDDDAIIVIQEVFDPHRGTFSFRKLILHMGPGFLMCIAYLDPGNLEADLQTGAGTGYGLLWLLLWSTGLGLLLQSLATKLGVTTGNHLAQHCRQQYSKSVRIILWIMIELCIIGQDIQQVIGAGIALLLLSGGALPLWAGVLIAAVAAYILLLLEKLGIRWLETFFQVLVGIMAISMGSLAFYADVPVAEVARGFMVPRLPSAALPTAAGLIGAIVMPHNLFLHSALVHARPLPMGCRTCSLIETLRYYNLEAALALGITLFINSSVISVFAKGFYGRKTAKDIGLENAGQFLGNRFGQRLTWIWAIGLLAAGQSSTMTGTYAGQFVMDGFLNLKMKLFQRALITRAVAIVPTMVVALSASNDSTQLDTLNQWINILQSIQLPFAVVPLLALTSSPQIVGIGFANSRSTAAVCWTVAVGVLVINAGTAYQTAVHHLPDIAILHVLFWGVVAAYGCFVAYLVIVSLRVINSRESSFLGAAGPLVDSTAPEAGRDLDEPLLQGNNEESLTPRHDVENFPMKGVQRRPMSPNLKIPESGSCVAGRLAAPAQDTVNSHALMSFTPS